MDRHSHFTAGVQAGPAASLNGNVGGWPQYFVPTPNSQINVTGTITVIPAF